MLELKFILLSDRKKIITGGHKYDKDLYDICNNIPNINITRAIIGEQNTSKWKRPIKELLNSIKSRKADIVIFNSSSLRLLPSLIWMRLFTKQRIYNIHHHFIYQEFKGLKRLVYKTIEGLYLKFSHKLIIPSPYIYNILSKKRRKEDLLLWRIPFDIKQKKVPVPIQGNLTFAGTIEPRKGIVYLLEALKNLQDNGVNYRLNIIGKVVDENYYIELNNYIAKHNLNVIFHGFIEEQQKIDIFSSSDLFVFPSLLEGFGMVLVEAQVYGLPIVSFDNTAMPFSVINDINGFTVPTFNTIQMANKIKEIVQNRELRSRLSKGAYENLNNQWNTETFKKTVYEHFNQMKNLYSN